MSRSESYKINSSDEVKVAELVHRRVGGWRVTYYVAETVGIPNGSWF